MWSSCQILGVSGKPIKLVGPGEKVKELEPFYPDRMASHILGMGDVVILVEKAAAEESEVDAAAMTKNMADATFDFDGGQIDTDQIAEVEKRLENC